MFWEKISGVVNILLRFMHLPVKIKSTPTLSCRVAAVEMGVGRDIEVPSAPSGLPGQPGGVRPCRLGCTGTDIFQWGFFCCVSSCGRFFVLQPTLMTGITETARLGHFSVLSPAMARAKSLGKGARKAGSC